MVRGDCSSSGEVRRNEDLKEKTIAAQAIGSRAQEESEIPQD
jgi:hypothetical protein